MYFERVTIKDWLHPDTCVGVSRVDVDKPHKRRAGRGTGTTGQ